MSSNQNKPFCVGGKQFSYTIKINEYEKLNPKSNKLVKDIMGKFSISKRAKSQFFTIWMTRGGKFLKKSNCENIHCSTMSKIAWCDIDHNIILRLHDFCPNPKCKCQKQFTLTPKQEGYLHIH